VHTCTGGHGAKAHGCPNTPQAAGFRHTTHHEHHPSHPVHACEPCPAKFCHCLGACVKFDVCVHGCIHSIQPTCEGCQPGRQPYLNRGANMEVAELEVGHQLVQVWSQSDEWWLREVCCKMTQTCHFQPPGSSPSMLISPKPSRQAPSPHCTHSSKSSP
jgi:hypothetical protein